LQTAQRRLGRGGVECRFELSELVLDVLALEQPHRRLFTVEGDGTTVMTEPLAFSRGQSNLNVIAVICLDPACWGFFVTCERKREKGGFGQRVCMFVSREGHEVKMPRCAAMFRYSVELRVGVGLYANRSPYPVSKCSGEGGWGVCGGGGDGLITSQC